ncbi:FERONIA [Hibiscus trionum]|uniref:FERONIA n=1 Tax=Hibiscus trionum TaxID=183268 RepID=A0A9W7IYD3_HIBTR|nr:FERONIA [Hibiscus trionum]
MHWEKPKSDRMIVLGLKCMYIFIYLYFHFILHQKPYVSADGSAYSPLETILLDCGSSSSQASSYDGRNWTTDSSHFVASNSGNRFPVSTSSSEGTSVPEVPYKTARIFHYQFTYTFNMTPGSKFVRLHFYPDSYMNLDASKSFLTVTAGNYTLIRNFSAYLYANHIKSPYFFKEFIVHVENSTLDLTFSPSTNGSNSYAFVNGIEIVSMPLDLYHRGNNVSAMETMHRVNVGGQSIPPNQDTGMSRSWTMDSSYIFGSAFGVDNYGLDASITYPKDVPAYTAPEEVYKTARSMGPSFEININYNLTWTFPIDSGFMYLIRVHLCEIAREITKINQRVFDIFIDNQVVERGIDIIALGHGNDVPLYRDYIVLVPNQTMKQDLLLELHPNIESKPQYYDAILNGVEIFKVSNSDGNLAGLNPSLENGLSNDGDEPSFGSSSSKSSTTVILIITGSLLVFVLALSLCVYLVAFRRKRKLEHARKRIARSSLPYHSFSISEIKMATDNFNEAKLIDRGAFGLVYKGYIDRSSTAVTIHRVIQAISKQEMDKFDAEIRMHHHIRHQNLVRLIGYCTEEHEVILVYESMPNGTLFELLHFGNQRQQSPLSWNQRLEICTEAARGLHYLHSAMSYPIIHGDIKTSNIFLDRNWMPKLSDFLPSKLALMMSAHSRINPNMKRTIAHLDPEYYKLRNLTEKSDVFSFGVMLLELLSGKQAINPEADATNANHEESLVRWALACIEKSEADRLVDQHLNGNIVPASLAKFVDIIEKCLADERANRPSMIEVLCSLELAQQLQLHVVENSNQSATDMDFQSSSTLMPGLEFYRVGR